MLCEYCGKLSPKESITLYLTPRDQDLPACLRCRIVRNAVLQYCSARSDSKVQPRKAYIYAKYVSLQYTGEVGDLDFYQTPGINSYGWRVSSVKLIEGDRFEYRTTGIGPVVKAIHYLTAHHPKNRLESCFGSHNVLAKKNAIRNIKAVSKH
ncbi:uncharacterized protein EAE98_001327 [Botrytis deweyae]|uniref:HNH endonuclease n=1 Tax=Botrytis deweyae TaxID=2478750 RepID=A0ABQ7J165_9HELO|nr:uncharacterized protein EAE98_001327 [Botrytis deweyae]KAF7938991.1 hypothetical protein EAE98_001327 [Botrytis deweyae]